MASVERLNALTQNMVAGIATGSPLKGHYVKEYFAEANKGLHGPAITSYFSNINSFKESPLYKHESSKLLDRIFNIIEAEVKKSPTCQNEAAVFQKSVTKDYPNSLSKRVYLAENGYVVADGVREQPNYKKIKRSFNKLIYRIKETETYKKIKEMCEPVE